MTHQNGTYAHTPWEFLEGPQTPETLFARIFDYRRLALLTGHGWPDTPHVIGLLRMKTSSISRTDLETVLERANTLLAPHETELTYMKIEPEFGDEWQVWIQQKVTIMPISAEEIHAVLDDPYRYAVFQN